MSRRALLVATSVCRVPDTARETGAYASELAEVWHELAAAGWTVDLATPRGGPVPLEAVDRDDPTQQELLTDPRMAALLAGAPELADVAGELGLVAVIGGHGAVWDLTDDRALAELVSVTHEAGGVVASVCHGAAGLLAAHAPSGRPLVAGRRVAAFTDAEERAVGMASVVPFFLGAEIERRGGEHDAGRSFLPHVAVDGRMVTGQNPASATDTARAAAATAAGSRHPSMSTGGSA